MKLKAFLLFFLLSSFSLLQAADKLLIKNRNRTDQPYLSGLLTTDVCIRNTWAKTP